MPNPITKIVNTVTGEEIERPMTKAELEAFQTANAKVSVVNAELKAREINREAVLAKLGLTVDEAALILG